MDYFPATSALARAAMSNLAKINRMLNFKMPNKRLDEISLQESTQELTVIATEVLDLTNKFLKLCEKLRDETFLKDFKL